jgi:hypothetical protein
MAVKNKGGRPKKDKNRRLGTQIGLRIKEDLIQKIDAKMLELEEEFPGSTWTRNDVVRYMLYKAFRDETK